MQARLCDSVSGRYRTEENSLLTKHVVAAGRFAKDAGSTPAASSLRSKRSENEDCRAEVRFWDEGGPVSIGTSAPNYDSASQSAEMEFSCVYPSTNT